MLGCPQGDMVAGTARRRAVFREVVTLGTVPSLSTVGGRGQAAVGHSGQVRQKLLADRLFFVHEAVCLPICEEMQL